MTARPASPLDALKPLAGRALEAALNRVLALDPDTHAALAALEGRRIALAVEAPPLALEITVHAGRLAVGPVRGEHEPDLSVRGTLGGLIAQLPFLRAQGGPPVGKVRIAGDAELARRLQKLAKDFAPDWDKPFADLFGEVVGMQLARAVRGALAAGLSGARALARDAADYLSEESRLVASKVELEQFHDEVDAVRERAERLAVRIQRLQARLPESGA
ncbi:MAG: SCP2 domain-containing protein [Rehaibacterium terrae]|uniref:ubiquinone biosynthesis accessory factor UbiJ n=1 Tax=Rehaibacterium terrae TaxID=1341696 RepID=UPI00391AD430